MSEAKPFASLSSGLLARKGAARPAMRPQGWSQQSSSLDDLGWNDMGHDDSAEPADGQIVDHPRAHHPTGLSPVTSPVHSQQAELADRLADEDEFDEDYDETAEPYEPEGGSGSFNGFDFSEDEDSEDSEEPAFRVQFKGGKKPLDLGPGPVDPVPAEVADDEAAAIAAEIEDVLELETEAEAEALDHAYAPLVDRGAPEPAVVPKHSYAPVPVQEVAPVVQPASVVPSARPARSAGAAKSKAAFTLRLDPERHLKLRLACAIKGRSAQQLVTDALDQYLGQLPELDHMAEQARRG